MSFIMAKIETAKNIHLQIWNYFDIWYGISLNILTPSRNVYLLVLTKAFPEISKWQKQFPFEVAKQTWYQMENIFIIYKWMFFDISSFAKAEKWLANTQGH